MTIGARRIGAVAASLRGIRERVQEHSDDSVWNTAAFDNAVSLLGGAIPDTDFSGHALDEHEPPAADYLVHLDSLIAFLEIYKSEDGEPRSILNLVLRQQG